MKQITVWTKQHRSVLEQLEKTGRYIARREYIEIENQECAPLVLEVYDWLVQHSDTQAYMSRFYPQIKREIIDSWDRLFDDSVHLNSDQRYGIIWEIKKEWVSAVLR